MSWAVSVQNTSVLEAPGDLTDALAASAQDKTEGVTEQFDAALAASGELVSALNADDVSINLSGHVKQEDSGADSEITVRVVAHGK